MKRLAVTPDTAIALIGLALLGIGTALVYLPLTFVVVGGLLLIYAILPDRGGPTP